MLQPVRQSVRISDQANLGKRHNFDSHIVRNHFKIFELHDKGMRLNPWNGINAAANKGCRLHRWQEN
jgi:hypothetical protein